MFSVLKTTTVMAVWNCCLKLNRTGSAPIKPTVGMAVNAVPHAIRHAAKRSVVCKAKGPELTMMVHMQGTIHW